MRKCRVILASMVVASAALVAVATTARADEYARWGGLYIGAHVGGAWSDLDWGLQYPFGNAPASTNFSSDSVIKGGHVGLQHQFGHWLVGAEASLSSGQGSNQINGVDLWAPDVGHLKTKIDWMFTVTGRLGYAKGNWLGYVKGGYAGAMIRLEADDNVPPDFGYSTRDLHHGWTIGAGVEHMITKGVILGVEYNYMDFSHNLTRDVVTLATNAPLGVTSTSNVDTSIHAVMARLSFKIGRDEDKHKSLK